MKSSRKKSGTAGSSEKRGKRRKSTRRKGLMGIGGTAGKVIDHVAKPLAVVGGFALGSFVGTQLDKVDALKVNDGDKIGLKTFAKPAILIGAGVGMTHFGGKVHALVPYVGYGVTGSGIVVGAKRIMKKDLFGGLGNSEVYTETADEVKRLLAENRRQFQPELPEFKGTNFATDPDLSGGAQQEANFEDATIIL